MKLSIKFRGELVIQGLQNLGDEIPKIGRRNVRVVMERIKRRMQEYPPERFGQSAKVKHHTLGYTIQAIGYKRTGNLGSHWAILNIGNRGYAIENTAQRKGKLYGRYVVGDAYGTGQAWMHQGRWQLLRDVADEETAKMPPEIEKELQIVARRVGL